MGRTESESGERGTEATPGAQILVVDDNLGTLTVLADALRAAGYMAVTTPDPREALALLAMERFDLVITDVVMPHLDGFRLLEKSKERNPGADVLLISAFVTDEIVKEALERGAAAVLPKPFEIGPFTAKVRELLSRRQI